MSATKKGKAQPQKKPVTSRLSVLVDGEPLSDDDARETWTAFSRHMDEHQGNTAGFAKSRGWASVSPEHRQGRAVLVVKTKA